MYINTDTYIRTLTAPDSVETIDAKRIKALDARKTKAERGNPGKISLRPSYDIRSVWRTVCASA